MCGLKWIVWLAVACAVLAPAAAHAQGAAIAGVVRDTSGAVLPGVSVEAASPVLIEKVRAAVTDGSGQYKIISLLPGTYTVTFTLQGFSTVKREGVEVTGSTTAAINADLKVGTLSETITVTGETPLVDVQSASVQKVVTKEVIDNIPTGRLGINLAALQPGMILGATSGTGALGGNANAATAQDVGGTAGDTFTDLSIHGGKASEQRQTIAGLSAATVIRFGESLSSSPSFTAMQEMSVDSSGADASLAGGGVRMNYVPRDGGNTFKGIMFFSGANGSMQSSNYTTIADDPVTSLQARGLKTQPGALSKVYDVNPGYGGPVVKDKLWWFATARWTQAENYVTQNYPNKNFIPGVTPATLLNNTTLTYAPDVTQPLQTAWGGGGSFWEQTLRLSWQATPKNKISGYYNNKKRDRGYYFGATPWTIAKEAAPHGYFFPFSDQLVQWSSPVNNRLLLEAGMWHHQETWGMDIAPFTAVDPLAIGVTDNNPQSLTPGYVQLVNNYRGVVGAAYTPSHNPNTRTNFAASYVTGSHAFKTGVDLAWAERGAWTGSIVPYSYIVSTLASNGKGLGIPVPTTLNLRSDGCNDPLARIVSGSLTRPVTAYNSSIDCPTFTNGKIDQEGGVFVQDRWTMNRVTLSLGLRLDWFYASLPSVHLGSSLLTPNRNYDVPAFDSVKNKDWTPKIGAAWDVFGDGKTALKMNLAKYVLGQSLVASNPLIALSSSNIVLTATRPWTDNNGNFIPDCDLTNAGAQGPTAAGSLQQVDTCGTVNPLFYSGAANFSALDPATGQTVGAGDDNSRYGWGKRPYSWEFSLSAQRELTKGISVNGGYFRRWFGNFLVTDNLSVQASDYNAYSITPSLIQNPAPASSGGLNLPSDIITSGFYSPTAAAAGRAANSFVGLSDLLFPGSNVIDHWNGFDLGVNMRLPHGVIFQGGTSTGRQIYDNCDIVDPANAGKFGSRSPLVESLITATATNPVSTCHVEQAWLTQLKFLGSYTVPKIDVSIGASYQNIPGIEVAANFAALNSDISRPTSDGGLGRLPSNAVSATATTTVSLIKPQAVYYDRLNQLDLRMGKLLRYGRTRANISLDLYNLFNKGTITGASFAYATWLAPSSVIAPRLAKVSVTFDF
ncbi:MAG: carboxypeptidase-like regulatory domain-containing protein [Acidobacteriota bacterium]